VFAQHGNVKLTATIYTVRADSERPYAVKADRAVFDGGSGRGFDPPQVVANPQKVLQNLFGGRL